MSQTQNNFAYPEALTAFVNSLSQNASFERKGKLTKLGIDFVNLLKYFEVSHLMSENLSDAKNLIKHSLINHVCLNCACNIRGAGLLALTPYCSMKCYKSSSIGREKISKIKKTLYSDTEWKADVEKKKTSTCFTNHGVLYPMQSAEIFRKHEKASVQSYTHRGVSGLRGYEKYVVDWLMDKFGFVYKKHFIVGSTARVVFDQRIIVDESHRYPDLYVIPWNTYIEVKSEYTLSKFDLFEETIDVVENLGSDYICILVNANKTLSQVCPNSRAITNIDSMYENFNLCKLNSLLN